MSNPLFQQMQPQDDFTRRFEAFKRTFNGDPQQIIQQMMNNGKISQKQLNDAVQMANKMMRFMK